MVNLGPLGPADPWTGRGACPIGHRGAVPVELGDGEVVAWLCTEPLCGVQLPASFRPPATAAPPAAGRSADDGFKEWVRAQELAKLRAVLEDEERRARISHRVYVAVITVMFLACLASTLLSVLLRTR